MCEEDLAEKWERGKSQVWECHKKVSKRPRLQTACQVLPVPRNHNKHALVGDVGGRVLIGSDELEGLFQP